MKGLLVALLAGAATSVVGCSPAPNAPTNTAVSPADQAAADANAAMASANAAANSAMAATNAADGAAEGSSQATGWTYSSTKDDMRGTTSYFADVSSDNLLEFGFPYEGGHAR